MGDHWNGTLQGWTPSPNGRGTIDILTSSCITLVLCSWTVLCLNVFPSHFSWWKRGYRKLLMACMTFAAPETTFQLAIGQWSSARRSMEAFRHSGYGDWSITHAFFADMGGFVLHPRLSTTEDWVSFPVNARQVHYLVVNGYLPYSAVGIDKDIIADKNKVDGFLRVITCFQILWYLISTVSRAVQGLAITVLELATVGFILCTLGTYFFWFHKPVDIQRAITLQPKATIQEILINAGKDATSPYERTPLDFVDQDDWNWSWNLYWTHWMGYLTKYLGIELKSKVRPLDKIPDDYFPKVTELRAVICCYFVQNSYPAVHVSGWDFHFPTRLEQTLWRTSTLGIMCLVFAVWALQLYAFEIPRMRKHRPFLAVQSKPDDEIETESSHLTTFGRGQQAFLRLMSYHIDYDPIEDVPLVTHIPTTVAAIIYFVFRGFIIVEGFLNLRALPPSSYSSVNWSAFLPHF